MCGCRATTGIIPLIQGATALFQSPCQYFNHESRNTQLSVPFLSSHAHLFSFLVTQVEGQSCLQDLPVQPGGIGRVSFARLGARTWKLVNQMALRGYCHDSFKKFRAHQPNAPAGLPWRHRRIVPGNQSSRASRNLRTEIP